MEQRPRPRQGGAGDIDIENLTVVVDHCIIAFYNPKIRCRRGACNSKSVKKVICCTIVNTQSVLLLLFSVKLVVYLSCNSGKFA